MAERAKTGKERGGDSPDLLFGRLLVHLALERLGSYARRMVGGKKLDHLVAASLLGIFPDLKAEKAFNLHFATILTSDRIQ